MFDVLATLFDGYWAEADLPTAATLQRMLRALGHDSSAIDQALGWLQRVRQRGACAQRAGVWCAGAPRLLAAPERRRLGSQGWRVLHRLRSCGAIDASTQERVLEAVMDTPNRELTDGAPGLIVCWVLWSQGSAHQALRHAELRPHLGVHTLH